MLKWFIIFVLAFFLLAVYACVVAAGRADDWEDRLRWREDDDDSE